MGYLTASSLPTDTICRVLFIPNSERFIANVTGALQLLTFPDNWEQYGLLTPSECAQALMPMFDDFCFKVRGCRMIGEMILWSGSAAPDDSRLLLCDGSLVSNDDYPDLWTIIGTSFGGSGAMAFALPDMRGKVAIGQSTTHGYATSGGAETVTLDVSEMPSHDHADTGHVHALAGELLGAAFFPGELPVDVPGPGEFTLPGSANITSTGGSGAHNNMQPFLTLNYYIVAL